jgi:hypothetical protein
MKGLSKSQDLRRKAGIRLAAQEEREPEAMACGKATHDRGVTLEVAAGVEGEPDDPETAVAKGRVQVRKHGSYRSGSLRSAGQHDEERGAARDLQRGEWTRSVPSIAYLREE